MIVVRAATARFLAELAVVVRLDEGNDPGVDLAPVPDAQGVVCARR